MRRRDVVRRGARTTSRECLLGDKTCMQTRVHRAKGILKVRRERSYSTRSISVHQLRRRLWLAALRRGRPVSHEARIPRQVWLPRSRMHAV